jgi:hypothetical protein
MKKEINTQKVILAWLNGVSNKELMLMIGINSLPKLYHILRGFLFSVAKENPEEMKKLVEKSTGKFEKRIMETEDARLRKQILVTKLLLSGESMVKIAAEEKMSYPKVKKLFREFCGNDEPILSTKESDKFMLANYSGELLKKVKAMEKKFIKLNKEE